jgi:hypothetical protein
VTARPADSPAYRAGFEAGSLNPYAEDEPPAAYPIGSKARRDWRNGFFAGRQKAASLIRPEWGRVSR